MAGDSIACPHCGGTIAISEVLANQVRGDIESRLQKEHEKRLQTAVQQAQSKAQDALNLELEDLRQQLVERERSLDQSRQLELEVRKKARDLEEKQKHIELELQRRLDEQRKVIESEVAADSDERHRLKLLEKEKQINDLRTALDDARRKSAQGSSETQGEVLEDDLEQSLRAVFADDDFAAVLKGQRGADILQTVRDRSGTAYGTILWEAKNTKNWNPAWTTKLRDDQRNASANLAILVSLAQPDDTKGFRHLDNVWVTDIHTYIALAMALRQQLVAVGLARRAAKDRGTKTAQMYDYLTGDQFCQRIEAIVETFGALSEGLNKERRAMERLWREREKQIERMALNTAGMYGELRGIVGNSLPAIPNLELEIDDDSDDQLDALLEAPAQG